VPDIQYEAESYKADNMLVDGEWYMHYTWSTGKAYVHSSSSFSFPGMWVLNLKCTKFQGATGVNRLGMCGRRLLPGMLLHVCQLKQ
jgi:hypothetical protein